MLHIFFNYSWAYGKNELDPALLQHVGGNKRDFGNGASMRIFAGRE
jgi:hypothetical protein